MSAFCDIWIGNSTTREAVRDGNMPWQVMFQNEGVEGALSKPNDAGKTFCEVYSEQGCTMIVLGQFYEPVVLSELLQDCIAYAKSNKPFNDPAGHYIIFVNDRNGKYHVFTNRCGTYHAYYKQEHNANIIATPFLSVVKAAQDKRLDWEGISGFFSMGYFPGDTTYLKNIKTFDAASYYQFDAQLNLVQKQRYWQWSYSPTQTSAAENIHSVNDVLANSISHATRDKRIALPISGGLDSRTIAGVLGKQETAYKSLWSYSYGFNKGSIEIEIARKIAHAKNMSFDGCVVPNYLFDEMEYIASATDLFSYVDGTRQACMINKLQQKADVVVGGHGGDLWFGSINTADKLDMPAYYRKKIKKRGSDWLLDNICAQYIDAPDELTEQIFLSYLDRYEDIENESFKLKAYKTDQWCARWTHTGIRMYQQAVLPVLPFYDKRIIDVFSIIPDEQLVGRELQIELLKKLYPDLAAIKWQEYENNLFRYKQFNNRNILYRIAKKAKRTLSLQPTIIRNWELFYLNAEGKKNLQCILIDQGILDDIIPREKVQAFLDEFYKNPTAANGYTMSMLHTFAQFIKRIG